MSEHCNSDISIIIPAYNEGIRIFDTIAETSKTMSDLGLSHQIVVVDDGSSDDTHKNAKVASEQFDNIKVVRYENNGGKGNAIKYGFDYVKGDLVAFLDADLDLHPRQIGRFLEYLEQYDADVVIGSKRHPLSKLNYPLQRRFLSTSYSILIKMLFNLSVTDTQTGLKLFKYQVLKEIFPKILVKRYAFDLEVLVNSHHRGYKIVEAPITLNFQRKFGRVGFGDVKPIAIDTAAIFYRLKILKYYDNCIGD